MESDLDDDFDDYRYGIDEEDDYPDSRPTVILMGHKRFFRFTKGNI